MTTVGEVEATVRSLVLGVSLPLTVRFEHGPGGYALALRAEPWGATWGTRQEEAFVLLHELKYRGLPSLTHDVDMLQRSVPLPEQREVDVILPPFLSAILVHECIGHTSEADNYANYASRLGLFLGDIWTSEALNVIDDPTSLGHSGSYIEDDEGVPGRSVNLIQDGRWSGLLTSKEFDSGVGSNGHGRRSNPKAQVVPRMAFLSVLPGKSPVRDLLHRNEVYELGGMAGAGSVRENMTMTPLWARRVIDGEYTDEIYRGLTIRAKKVQLIGRLAGIGDEQHVFDPYHPCSKNNQDIQVTMGAPHLLLRKIRLYPDAAELVRP